MEFKQILLNILSDIQEHKRDLQDLTEFYIQKRLNRSLINYYSDLLKDSNMILSRDAQKMLRELSK